MRPTACALLAALLAAACGSNDCMACATARLLAPTLSDDAHIWADSLPEGDGCDDWRLATSVALIRLEDDSGHMDTMASLRAFTNGTTERYEREQMQAEAEAFLVLVNEAREEACA